MRHVLEPIAVAQLLQTDEPLRRIPLRLDDLGVAALLLSLRKVFPQALVSFPVVDLGCVPVESLRLAAVPQQVEVVPGQAGTVEAFYSKLLLPVELELLDLQEVSHRRRVVFAALVHGRVRGACVVHRRYERIEPAHVIEQLRVDPELTPADYEDVWNALARAAVCEVARHGDRVVSALHPADRPLAARVGLLPAQPEQYVLVSVARREDVALRVSDHIMALQRAPLAAA